MFIRNFVAWMECLYLIIVQFGASFVPSFPIWEFSGVVYLELGENWWKNSFTVLPSKIIASSDILPFDDSLIFCQFELLQIIDSIVDFLMFWVHQHFDLTVVSCGDEIYVVSSFFVISIILRESFSDEDRFTF